MATARFIYDTPWRSPDLYYASGFSAPDPFIYFEVNYKKYIAIKDMEFDRAKKISKANKVLQLSHYTKKAEKKFKKPTEIDVLDAIFKDFRIKKIEMPPESSFDLVNKLKKRGYKIVAGEGPFYSERAIKTKEEKKMITDSQKTVFTVMGMVEKMLRSATVRKNILYYKGKPLTCEGMRTFINVELLRLEHQVPEGSIVTCGKNSFLIHSKDNGPLRPNEPIIVDIYPRSMKTLYCGDATRTFFVCKASDKIKKMYDAVKAAHDYAIKNIRSGVNGKDIHAGVHKVLVDRGFKSGEINGMMQGFIHSTGHGVGVEVHDLPVRIAAVDEILKPGMIFSVEPGLYYKGVGGVRIEDLVYVTKNGCEVLGHYPIKLEI